MHEETGMTPDAGHSADEWYRIGDAALRRRDAPGALTAFRSVLAADDRHPNAKGLCR